MKARWYVGKKGATLTPFKSETVPTQDTHGDKFNAVIGPFRTRRGAWFHAAVGANNPHIQHVNDAERLAKV